MSRLCGKSISEVQSDRLGTAREFSASHAAVVVLKGHHTVIAFPDDRATLVETAPGVTANDVLASTEAELVVPEHVPQMAL